MTTTDKLLPLDDEAASSPVSPDRTSTCHEQPTRTVHSPSYKGLVPASAASSIVKQHNRRHDTTPEIILRHALWRKGLRFRTHAATLPGKPDLIFVRARVAVFCDGDFWHGRNWQALQAKLEQGSNASYWTAKIVSNRERDRLNTQALIDAGWRVLRFWETDIKRDPDAVARVVEEAVHASRQKMTQVPQCEDKSAEHANP